MAIKFLPVSYFEKEGPKATGPIWAINTADTSELKTAGEVVLPIPKSSGVGDPDIVKVPQTWLPFELTSDVTRPRLLRASLFRKAVTKGLIGLIDEETAARLLRQEGAAEEQARLKAVREHIRTAGAARTIADSKSEISLADGSDPDDDGSDDGLNSTVVLDHNSKKVRAKEKTVAQLAAAGVEEEEPGISVQLRMWVQRLNKGKDDAAYVEVKARRSFKRVELVYLSRELSSKFVKTLAMVNRNLHGGKVKKAA